MSREERHPETGSPCHCERRQCFVPNCCNSAATLSKRSGWRGARTITAFGWLASTFSNPRINSVLRFIVLPQTSTGPRQPVLRLTQLRDQGRLRGGAHRTSSCRRPGRVPQASQSRPSAAHLHQFAPERDRYSSELDAAIFESQVPWQRSIGDARVHNCDLRPLPATAAENRPNSVSAITTNSVRSARK